MTTLSPDGDKTNLQQPEKQQSLLLHGIFNDSGSTWDTCRYQPVSEIGVGAYGVVFKARDRESDDGFVAMKCLRVENTEQGIPLSMVREIALLKHMESKEHPNVVRLLDVCLGRKTLYETQIMLVFEHIDQDLDMYLKEAPEAGLEDNQIKDIMRQIFLGIDFLHSMRVIHRDLKPQNILVTKSGHIKIADFGLARIYSYNMALTAVVVTRWYRAPEVLLQDSYATPVDMWSAGCIFAELYNLIPLFRGSGDINQLKKIFNFIGLPPEDEWPPDVAIPISSFSPQNRQPVENFVPRMVHPASDLFMKLLLFNPNQRLTPKDALAHSYFQTAGSPEPPFLSNAVNKAMRYTQQAALHKDAGTSKHRRLPYTQQMSSCHGEALKNSGHSALHWTRDYDVCDGPGPSRSQTSHSSITPVIEQVTTEDTEDIFDGESQHPLPNETDRKRSFGNPLPVDSKDGATGHIQAQRSPSRFYDGTGFLTPPSDLASSPSICETPPSSRSSSSTSLTDEGEDLKSQRHRKDLTFPSTREGAPLLNEETVGVVRRTHATDVDEKSRMSWADLYSAESFYPDEHMRAGLPATSIRPSLKTPTYQILESGKFVPDLKGSSNVLKPPENAPQHPGGSQPHPRDNTDEED